MTDGVSRQLLRWYDAHGRKDLPWQQRTGDAGRDAYRVWLSEVMLQQTQVATVAAYFERFVAALPGVRELAAASEDQVLALWSGLGYYRRARYLHEAARLCVARHGGELPDAFAALRALPGIGRSTAGAILAQAFGQRWPILDGNVKRVLARYHGVHGDPATAAVARVLWQYADAHTPARRVADYTQAIMDLGATVCLPAQPRCADCPLAATCVARRDGLTARLPTRRARRVRPTRATCLVIVRDRRGHILLERRGPHGVWPGLWSLPEAADEADARQQAAAYAHEADVRRLAAFTHVFTHFRLDAQPLLFDGATRRAAVADDPGRRWCTRAELARLGLPAPVRRLLLEISDEGAVPPAQCPAARRRRGARRRPA